MNTSQIYSAIGERVDDPDKLQYGDRYENVFVNAMTELMKLRDDNGFFVYPSEEFPELTEAQRFRVQFSNGWFKEDFSNIANLMYIRDIYIDASVELDANVTQKRDYLWLQHAMSNKYLAPSGSEIFWTKKCNTIFIISNIQNNLEMFADVILNPNPTSWGSQDLVATLGYGLSFILASITLGANILRKEIGLE